MNLLIRTIVSRPSSLFIARRHLATERSRRALRSSLIPEKLRSSMPSSLPRSNNQRPFGFINEKNVILGIIAVNGIVFVTWRFSYANFRTNNDQRLLWFMTKNFSMYFKRNICIYMEFLVVSWNGVVRENRVWTLLTSAFSHFDFTHFLINSFVLYSFGKTSI
jgi:membrane associated rhomboid family serine protease